MAKTFLKRLAASVAEFEEEDLGIDYPNPDDDEFDGVGFEPDYDDYITEEDLDLNEPEMYVFNQINDYYKKGEPARNQFAACIVENASWRELMPHVPEGLRLGKFLKHVYNHAF